MMQEGLAPLGEEYLAQVDRGNERRLDRCI